MTKKIKLTPDLRSHRFTYTEANFSSLKFYKSMYAHTDIFFGTKMMYDGIQLLQKFFINKNTFNLFLKILTLNQNFEHIPLYYHLKYIAVSRVNN